MATAGIIVIGNEILSGKVEDSNSPYLARQLRALGVDLLRISVIPDEIETIAAEARAFSAAYDHVFTSGGVGPTHDDVTMEGVARGFGVRVVRHPLLEAGLRAYFGEGVTEAALKMAEVPEGTDLVAGRHRGFPVTRFKNIYILPGIPKYFVDKFESIKDNFKDRAIHLRRFYVTRKEEEIARHLNATLAEFPELMLGSYPQLDTPDYCVLLTLESREEDYLRRGAEDLRKRLEGAVWRED